ncbi:hypothetical protein Rcas_3250 [Roseiflexus castenholzii DSM 13941]|jgi:hypothetical protein|uniref:Transposase IS4 family protein n=1 Tax=Roseiflexus castenholzii (strain DSM 13941 / HLO8) TaxID=383372 RepID=A7NP07_ROSCS|nr:hypothetical protein Rcas_3250 [Roseiflexus castenholzii DSM 13941]
MPIGSSGCSRIARASPLGVWCGINAHRLEWLQQDPQTRYRQDGVIAIDNPLIDHDGTLIEDASWFWDHADKRHLIAHDYRFANDVNPSGKHYPLDFRRFRKNEQCDADRPFKDQTERTKELIDWVAAEDIPGDFTFDRSVTNAPMMNPIHAKQRRSIGDVNANRVMVVNGVETKVSAWVKTLTPLVRTTFPAAGHTQWYFTTSVRLPRVNHPVRVLVLWSSEKADEPRTILVTNRTHWEAHRILKVSKRRWSGTETFHRDGKQHLGMGDCQLRDGMGQTRHMDLVTLASTALMRQMKHDRALDWAHTRLMTIGESCCTIARETLGKTLVWAIEQAQHGMSRSDIKRQFALP